MVRSTRHPEQGKQNSATRTLLMALINGHDYVVKALIAVDASSTQILALFHCAMLAALRRQGSVVLPLQPAGVIANAQNEHGENAIVLETELNSLSEPFGIFINHLEFSMMFQMFRAKPRRRANYGRAIGCYIL